MLTNNHMGKKNSEGLLNLLLTLQCKIALNVFEAK